MPLVLALVLALAVACAPDTTAVNRPIDVPQLGDSADVSSEPGGDAAADALACVPACAAGQVCSSGQCVALADASQGDASDAAPLEDVPAPTYRSCEPVGSACADGMTCRAVPVDVDAGARGVCTRACTTSSECPGFATRGALCVRGFCAVECARDEGGAVQGLCDPWGTSCVTSMATVPDQRFTLLAGRTAYCAPR